MAKKAKLLSIIIPTYNRGNIIAYTLSLFHDQIIRNKEEVELIVCNNASTDNTLEILRSMLKDDEWFTCVNYPDHVGIDLSIQRSINNANGTFFNLFGDDDVPSPTMVETVLTAIKNHPQIGLITYNRMNGFSDSSIQLRGLSVKNNTFDQHEILYTDSKKFTERYYGDMGFLSVDVVNMNVWKKGLPNYNPEHEGYSFLTVMHSGAIGYNCLYIQYPLCIQRDVLKGGNEHEFSNVRLGVYQFVSIPRILRRLEELGAINNWKQCFTHYYPNQLDDWYYTFVCGAADNPEEYSKYYNEIITYQSNKSRINNTKKLFVSAGKRGYVFAKIAFKIKTNGLSYIYFYFQRSLRRLWHKILK